MDPDDSGIEPIELDAASLHKLADYVEMRAVERRRAQGKLDEYDFLCGAMSVYFALGLQGKIPASWIFSAFSGEPPLRADKPPKTLTLVELAHMLDANGPTLASINRRVYADTPCGAHISVREPGTPGVSFWHHNGSTISEDLPLDAVQVGSICEQCDAEFTGDVLDWPFTEDDVDLQMRGIDEQVKDHWAEQHDVPEPDTGYDQED